MRRGAVRILNLNEVLEMEIELVSDYFINYYIVKKTSMAFSYTYSLFLGFPTS